jgi:hypothetical protein
MGNMLNNKISKIVAVMSFAICFMINSCTNSSYTNNITGDEDYPLVIQKVFMNMGYESTGRIDTTKLAFPYFLFFKCRFVNNTADTLRWRAVKLYSDFGGSFELPLKSKSPFYAEVYCHLKNGDSLKLYTESGYSLCDSIQYIFPKDTFYTCFSFDDYMKIGTRSSLDSIAALVDYIAYTSSYDSICYVFPKSKTFYIEHLYSEMIVCGWEQKSCYAY